MTSQTVDEVSRCGGGIRRAFQEYSAQGALQQNVVIRLAPPVPFSENLGVCGSEELRVGLAAEGELGVVLFAGRSAVALYRLLDVLPVFSGDDRITRLFTLVPGSNFGAAALAAIDALGGRTVPWSEAYGRTYDLVVATSPKGDLRLLRGPHVLLPHGAGFNKSIPGDGSTGSASGLDPVYLRRTGHDDAPIALHALAHPDQIARLAATGRRPPGRRR